MQIPKNYKHCQHGKKIFVIFVISKYFKVKWEKGNFAEKSTFIFILYTFRKRYIKKIQIQEFA